MKLLCLSLTTLALAAGAFAELPVMRAAPTRPPPGPSVVMEEFEVLPDCQEERVCAEGLIRNIGSKTAYAVRLRIDIGGVKGGKPRTSFYQDLEVDIMESTEAQSVTVTVPRKQPYRNSRGENKFIEVGRYNFKVVPVWRDSPKPPPPPKRVVPRKK